MISPRPASIALAEPPPYRAALLAALVVLGGYVFTLAPTVTFWDAGEFIAAAHILGIPHPPGTPLFVLLGHVWDLLWPLGATAHKTNLMTAAFSAAGAGFLFLLMHQALARATAGLDPTGARIFRLGGAMAAAVLSAFAFTVWQNSNETEVYMVATFSIAAIGWLCWLWRRERGGVRGAHLLLLIVYLLALSIGNHLMGLLVGPAVIGYLFHVLKTEPAADPKERQVQWAECAVVAALWVAMVGVGIGSTGLLVLGLALFAGAAAWAFAAGSALFAVTALLVTAAGVSTYLMLYIRSGLQPMINEADPSTFDALKAVIRREQYPVRSPLDNPIFPHGPDNPGRTIGLLWLQIRNYLQYFDWQWSAGLDRASAVFSAWRAPFTVLFALLGLAGARAHRRWDRSTFYFLLVLFLTTSIGLVLYLNFKPGFSIGLPRYDDAEMREVRERDYFFTVSFLAWGLWAGLGLATAYRALQERLRQAWAPLSGPEGPGGRLGRGGRGARAAAWVSALVFAGALLPPVLNFRVASRRHGPEATLARDFAYDMLQSAEPYAILFTNGDNDTFPLWYLQEVEGVRQDVVIVNLSLVNTDWYIRQLRDNPARRFDPEGAPAFYRPLAPAQPPACDAAWTERLASWARAAGRRPPSPGRPPLCLHTLSDQQIAEIQPQLLPQDLVFRAGNVVHTYRADTPLLVKDIMVLRLIQENLGRRPIYWALTTGRGNWQGLDRYLVQQGVGFRLQSDSVRAGPGLVPGFLGALVDVERTRALCWDVYRYAGLLTADSLALDPTNENISGNLAYCFLTLGEVYRQSGDLEKMLANYRRMQQLSPNPELREFLRQYDLLRENPALPGGGR